jgi:hypothetical protein
MEDLQTIVFILKHKDLFLLLMLEHGMGKTRFGSVLGLVFSSIAGIFKLLTSKKEIK